MFRDRQRPPLLNVLHCRPEGRIGTIGFRCGCQVDSGMSQRNTPFRHAEKFKCLLGGKGNPKGVGVCEANIFGSCDYQPPGNKTRVLSSVEHLSHPVESGIWI